MKSSTSFSQHSLRPAFCGLLPHPPIIVPAVGKGRLRQCQATVEACRELARRLVAARPERLFLVSPHSPRRERSFGIWGGDRLHGDLGQFGAPSTTIDVPNDVALREALAGVMGEHRVSTWTIPTSGLDHGAIVPLYFLAEAGWCGPTLIASLPWQAAPPRLEAFGGALAAAAGALGTSHGKLALVASGDMSHRCTPEAPAGFHPRGVEHDRQLTDLLRRGELRSIGDIDPDLRQQAAEDSVDACCLVASAFGYAGHEEEILSYEHPFGVGYLVAILHAGLPRLLGSAAPCER